MADLIDDQTYTRRFWTTFAQVLTSKFGASNGAKPDANWFMPAAQALIANFTAVGKDDDSDSGGNSAASDTTNFVLALYDFANRIPQWSVSWTGNQDGDYYRTYRDYVSQLKTIAVLSGKQLSDAQTELDALEGKLISFSDDVGKLRAQFTKDYMENYLVDDGSGKKTWLPGYSPATMAAAWNRHRTTPGYRAQVEDIRQSRYSDLSGIRGRINALQNAIYGAGFSTVQEAQNDAIKADPDFPNSWDSDDEREVFQMKAGSEGWLPKFEVEGGENAVILETYKKWLKAAQDGLANNDKAKYSFSLQSSALEQQNADAKLSFNAVVPAQEILLIDVSGGVNYKSAYTQKEDFALNVSYQDLFLLPVQPGRRWFNSEMIRAYGKPTYFTKGSVFAAGPLGGPKGVFNLQVNAVMIGVGRSIEFTSQKFSEYDWSENFHADVGVSILGLIHLGGGSVSESYSSTSIRNTDTGFVISDTSGAPSIVGLLVQQVFPPDA